MKLEITEIEKFRNKYEFRFSGTLRNQYDFEIGEFVYIKYDGKMMRCRVLGKEMKPIDNADFIYKIEIPNTFNSPIKEDTIKLKCDSIFRTKSEAKESAERHLKSMYDLDLENLNKFFEDEDLNNSNG